MTDYTALGEKLRFSPRMQSVYEAVAARLLPYAKREGTATSPALPGGKNPFLETFATAPTDPRPWSLTPGVVSVKFGGVILSAAKPIRARGASCEVRSM